MWFRHKSILYLGGVIGGVACNYPFFLINTRPLSFFFSHCQKQRLQEEALFGKRNTTVLLWLVSDHLYYLLCVTSPNLMTMHFFYGNKKHSIFLNSKSKVGVLVAVPMILSFFYFYPFWHALLIYIYITMTPIINVCLLKKKLFLTSGRINNKTLNWAVI